MKDDRMAILMGFPAGALAASWIWLIVCGRVLFNG